MINLYFYKKKNVILLKKNIKKMTFFFFNYYFLLILCIKINVKFNYTHNINIKKNIQYLNCFE